MHKLWAQSASDSSQRSSDREQRPVSPGPVQPPNYPIKGPDIILWLAAALNRNESPTSEEGVNHVNDLILGIHNRQGTPFVKCQARMRNVKGNHVANAQIVFMANL